MDGKMSLYRECFFRIVQIMVKELTFIGFRWGDRPPLYPPLGEELTCYKIIVCRLSSTTAAFTGFSMKAYTSSKCISLLSLNAK